MIVGPRPGWWARIFGGLIGIGLLLGPSPAAAGSVSLAWDPNAEADLAGYQLYYGQSSGNYQFTVDVGNQTTYTLSGLADGETYYFAVTAYDTSGNESNFSNEITTTIPGIPQPPVAAFSASPTSGPAPLTIAFTDTSTGSITTWAWDFGDGASSTAPSPSHTYADPGTYTVSRAVTGSGGSDAVTIFDFINVAPPPTGSSLVSSTTMRDNSQNFALDHPVVNLWDGCTDTTPQCTSGAGNIASFWVEFDFGQLYDLSQARLFGDVDGNWLSSSWSL